MQTSSDRFNTLAENFARSEVHRTSPSMHSMAALLEPMPNMRILDIACGPGHFGFSLAHKATSIIGIDPSPRMLEEFSKASKSFSIPSSTRVGHAEQIPAEANEFDLTISRLAPHHFSDIKIAIAELYRVTKPRGLIGLRIYSWCKFARAEAFPNRNCWRDRVLS